jgi:hypothetical protein
MAKSRCRFLVPVNYNDGRPVEPEFFIQLKMALDRQFGGFRIVPPTEGCWQGQVELTHEIEVAVAPKRIPELREVVIQIGRELGQTAMYFDAPPPSVEIIDVATGEDKDNEEEESEDEK